MTRVVIRLLDVVGSLGLLVLCGLPMLFIAAAIRLDDGGPVLFRQVRVGRGCRLFTILKFRTMREDGDGSGRGTLRSSGETLEQANARFRRTVPGDPRITRLGQFLRPSHMDELPQLVNVLKGDMSFVGVRPDTPVQEADYNAEYWRFRHRLRPGISGPAQLRDDPLDLAQRNAEEMRWLEGYGVKMYLSMLARTVGKVLHRSSF